MAVGLDPKQWHDVFASFATICAALLGLFFVAVSLHPREVAAHPVLRYRSRGYLQGLAAGIALSVFTLVPGQSDVWLGIEFIVTEVVLIAVLLPTPRSQGRGPGPSWPWAVAAVAGFALVIVAGLNLIFGAGPGLFLIVPALLEIVFQASWGAWTVLIGRTAE